jgi:hypothetical protein
MRLKRNRNSLPLMTLALCVAGVSAAASFGQAVRGQRDGASQGHRVAASGRLIGTRELQRVVVWQTAGTAHLAIETVGSRPRILWQMDGGNSESIVDSVRVSDLDGDRVPEIISLWRRGSSGGAVLRVFHWDRAQQSFKELQFEGEINSVYSYRVVPAGGNRSSSRLAVDIRSETGGRRSPVPVSEYELRGSRLVRVGGDRVVTTQSESGIEGQAVISPAHPGPQREGLSSSAPYKTTLVVWSAGDDREVKRFETGSDGRFRVALPPGDYRVGPVHQSGRFLPRGSEVTVTVAPGKFVQVTIEFDSGMR